MPLGKVFTAGLDKEDVKKDVGLFKRLRSIEDKSGISAGISSGYFPQLPDGSNVRRIEYPGSTDKKDDDDDDDDDGDDNGDDKGRLYKQLEI